jgi:hypothetical protein
MQYGFLTLRDIVVGNNSYEYPLGEGRVLRRLRPVTSTEYSWAFDF